MSTALSEIAETEALDLELASVEMSDLGNATRLRKRFASELLHVRDVGWHTWDGRRWQHQGGDLQALIFAHNTAELIAAEAEAWERHPPIGGGKKAATEHRARFNKLKRWSQLSQNRGRTLAMLEQARPYVSVEPSALDQQPMILNVLNGKIDLEGEIFDVKPHDRERRLTRCAAVTFDRTAQYPRFQAFLDRILPDRHVQCFVQQWFGYCLTGSTGEQAIVIYYGSGSNGKSTLLEIVARVLADYACSMPFASLLHSDRMKGSEASPDIARLPGARLVRAAEPELGSRFSESLIKSLTGGEPMTARKLHKEFFEFMPQFKLTLSANAVPQVRGLDDGIWRRLLLVPFEQKIPPAERDKNLVETILREEASGVLNWMLEGCAMWQEEGRLRLPSAVQDAINAYRAEMNPVGQFLEACVTLRPNGVTSARALRSAYEKWCGENSLDPVSQVAFGRALTALGFKKEKTGIIFYRGIELNEESKPVE